MLKNGSGFRSLFVLLLMLGTSPTTFAGDDWTDWVFPPWHKQPTIGLSYGPTRSYLEGISLAPANTAVGELLLGGTRITPKDSDATVLRYSYQYFSIANFNNDYGPSPAAGVPTTNIWRFALGSHSGYGYQLSDQPDGPSQDEFAEPTIRILMRTCFSNTDTVIQIFGDEGLYHLKEIFDPALPICVEPKDILAC